MDRLVNEWSVCQTSHWLRIGHCMSAAADPLDIFPFAANPNWLGIGPTSDGGHVPLYMYTSD